MVYEYSGGARHEKLHDVPVEDCASSSSSDNIIAEENEQETSDLWDSEDDDSDIQSDNDEVEDKLLHELNKCYPDGTDPASMREGFTQLLRILEGEQYSSE